VSDASSDILRLHFVVGPQTFLLRDLGLTWPPPERLIIDDDDGLLREATDDDEPGYVLHRVSMSQLTDEEAAAMTHVARGAEYRYADDRGADA
jgi:hypothetical protein